MLNLLKLCCGLLAVLLASHAYAADHHPGPTSAYAIPDHSIRFIALPYLHAFHLTEQNQAVIYIRFLHTMKFPARQWDMIATAIPEYIQRNGRLQTVDIDHASGPRLSPDGTDIIIPLPVPLAPISVSGIERRPLWLQFIKAGIAKQAWHAPALTPVAAALALAEQKRKARLAKRMADRAFYFGYDINKDALK